MRMRQGVHSVLINSLRSIQLIEKLKMDIMNSQKYLDINAFL